MYKQVLCVVALLIVISTAYAQEHEDTPVRRNTVKVDLTSYWLYRNSVIFSYERVVKKRPYHTWAITAGLQQFPSLVGTIADTIAIKKQNKATGYKIGGEYRFYLQKENKYGAPRGVYLGPYVSFHQYRNTRGIEVNNNGAIQSGTLDSKFDILNLGVQLGYQFVLNNRWTIDLVFVGPSVSNYKLKSQLDGDFTFDEDEITNEVILEMMDRYPGFKELITEGNFSSQGKVNKWAFGYRYQLLVGYHFGRKKK